MSSQLFSSFPDGSSGESELQEGAQHCVSELKSINSNAGVIVKISVYMDSKIEKKFMTTR